VLTALRHQVREHLEALPAQRKPALRRTDDPGALLMTDLPRIAGPEEVAAFIAALEKEGWRAWQEPGWLLLDHDVPVPDRPWPDAFPGEWGCCLRLLRAHPGKDAPREYIRALVKAAEQGNDKVERLCKAWHGEFAARMREHQPLPGGLVPYLLAAMKEETR